MKLAASSDMEIGIQTSSEKGPFVTRSIDPDLRTPLYIGGQAVETERSFPVSDPGAPNELVGYAASATPEEARAAVHLAHSAWRGWNALDPERRAEWLRNALLELAGNDDERVELLVRENGKVRSEAEIELAVFNSRCELAAGLAAELKKIRRLGPDRTRPEPVLAGDGEKRLRRMPATPFRSEVSMTSLGVVTIIIPYNWPLAILAASLPYALIAGNTVIVKPPPTAPLATVRTLELMAAKLPPGVLNIVTGSNEDVAPLITDPLVAKIVFTGSTAAGKKIMTLAAEHLARVTLELGGNDPAIILDDAKLDDAAIQRLVVGSFLTSGQVCMGIKRIYVHHSRYDEVVGGMSEVLKKYRVGHGLDPRSTIGPLNNARQKAFVLSLLEDARAAGNEVLELGTLSPEAEVSGGHYLRPSLVLDPSPNARIVKLEQFGPALPILCYDDVDELLIQLNHEWSGLCSSVWSADLERAADVASRLRTGTTWINNANAVAEDDRVPFGGFRQSGIGRELGVEGLLGFTELHSVTYPS